MNKTISDIRLELEMLITQKEKIKEQLILMNNDVNRKDQELRNMLGLELVGRLVKRTDKRNPIMDRIPYGVIHSVVDVDTVKIMKVGFTMNNKIDRSCELAKISDLEFVPESEVAKYLFDTVMNRYNDWRGTDE